MTKHYECIKCGYCFEKESKLMAVMCPLCGAPGKALEIKPRKKWADKIDKCTVSVDNSSMKRRSQPAPPPDFGLDEDDWSTIYSSIIVIEENDKLLEIINKSA